MKEWYILHHPAQQFLQLQTALKCLGVECFMPEIMISSPRSDRTSLRPLRPKPLFPCYLFVKFDPEEIHTTEITRLKCASSFVRCGESICTIREKDILAMKANEMTIADNDDTHIHLNGITPRLLGKIRKIYKITDETQRISALMQLLKLPSKLSA